MPFDSVHRRGRPPVRAVDPPAASGSRPDPFDPPDSLGALLAQARAERGWSQLRLAEQLCAAAGVSTVSRHEVSRWERQQRVPGPFWLGWLAAVLDLPIDRLAAARPTRAAPAAARRRSPTGACDRARQRAAG